MSRTGSLVICVQNLDFSGANQVVLNTVAGSMHGGGNVIIVSPRQGPIASKFVENGRMKKRELQKQKQKL